MAGDRLLEATRAAPSGADIAERVDVGGIEPQCAPMAEDGFESLLSGPRNTENALQSDDLGMAGKQVARRLPHRPIDRLGNPR